MSKAFVHVRSAMKRYTGFLDCLASSVMALRVRRGAAVPPPGRAPNWASSTKDQVCMQDLDNPPYYNMFVYLKDVFHEGNGAGRI